MLSPFPSLVGRIARRFVVLAGLLFSGGCTGVQSTLDPGGRGAEKIASLFWWMTGIGAFIWLGVVLLALYAVRAREHDGRRRQAQVLVWCGAAIPTVALTVLLIGGLGFLPELLAPPPAGALRITVHGEQWWWRARYEPPGIIPFEVANELYLPVNEPVEFLLHSNNVIHSFWIPSLGGKMDMIPGRTNRLTLHPTRIGAYRGVCAEYCGLGHAHMAFQAFVVARADFDRWLVRQSQPAAGAQR